MKTLLFVLAITSVGCMAQKELDRLNTTCCNTTSSEGKSDGKIRLTIVLSTKDQQFLDDSSCRVFRFDKKNDKSYLKIIKRDFVIRRLNLADFESQVNDSMFYYENAKEFIRSAINSESSFIFITTHDGLIYSPTFLFDKKGIQDLLWAKFGP